MKCPFAIKKCKKCEKLLVACDINFNKKKTGKYGYSAKCKKCTKEYKHQYYEEHKEEVKEKQQRYYEEHKEEVLKYKHQYYEEHKEEKREYDKLYREEHKEERAEYNKQYYEEHKEEKREYDKLYRENNPHICFNNYTKRRQLEENQGRGITEEQWYEMFCFFNWECAYSGVQLNKDNRTIDHIVALNNGGLNEIWNCVPMYANYNYSKRAKNMLDWYKQQEYFNETRLEKIYAWCEYAFDKWKPRRKGNKKYNK